MSNAKKYRKKPVVIEAMQWDGSAESAAPIINWALSFEDGAVIRYHEHLMNGEYVAHPDPFLWVDTLEGRMIATSGDFIIRGVNGEFYPCKPDIFAKTYELEKTK
jgi:hypothetical protein